MWTLEVNIINFPVEQLNVDEIAIYFVMNNILASKGVRKVGPRKWWAIFDGVIADPIKKSFVFFNVSYICYWIGSDNSKTV